MTLTVNDMTPRYRQDLSPSKQRGVATLVTAVILMLAVLSISFYLSEVVIKEKQAVAIKQRGFEAFNAAMSGMDYGTYLVTTGLVDGSSDFSSSAALSIGSYTLSIPTMVDNIYTITSTGFSDDSSVSRVISKSLAKLPSTTAPPSVPVVSKGAVDVGGGAIGTSRRFASIDGYFVSIQCRKISSYL